MPAGSKRAYLQCLSVKARHLQLLQLLMASPAACDNWKSLIAEFVLGLWKEVLCDQPIGKIYNLGSRYLER